MNKRITAIVLTLAMLIGVSSCLNKEEEFETVPTSAPQVTEADTQAPSEDETVAETSEETEEETEPAATPVPTGVPFDAANYSNFGEPRAYEVIEEAIAYTDRDVQDCELVYPVGAVVSVIGTDGTYVELDNLLIVEASKVQPMQ